MTALIFNIFLDSKFKFDIFKVTYSEIQSLFEEKHIKIRGRYAEKALDFIKKISINYFFYQNLPDKDWIQSFLLMSLNVKSKACFIYIEDHKLTKNIEYFRDILISFEKFELDYLCYSWYYSSNLYFNNLLPLNPSNFKKFLSFKLDKFNFLKLRNISGSNFYPFSICSLISTKHLIKILNKHTLRKVYCKYFSIIIIKIFGYPYYRYVFELMNKILKFFKIRIYINPINQPDNLEVHKIETNPFINLNETKFAVLKDQLFTSVDDDNGHYGESLLKMGRFPFDLFVDQNSNKIVFTDEISVKIKNGDNYPLQYIPYSDRYYDFPVIEIFLIKGKLTLVKGDLNIDLEKKKSLIIHSSQNAKVYALEESILRIKIGFYN